MVLGGGITIGVFDSFKASVEVEWKALQEHPFPNEMARGELPGEKFQYYLRQDEYYLEDMIRCFGMLVSKGRDRFVRRLGIKLLDDTLGGEVVLHDDLIQEGLESRYGVSDAALAYEKFLLKWADEGDDLDILVSLCPCVVSYNDIAKGLVGKRADSLPSAYSEWIESYAGSGYSSVVEYYLDALEKLMVDADEERLERSRAIFKRATELERLFWDSSYNSSI